LKVKRGETQPFTLEAAAGLLPDSGTALLEYVVGAERSYLFVITRAAAAAPGLSGPPVTLNVYPLDVDGKTLAGMIDDFRDRVARRELTIKTPARRLYELLVGPAEKQLAGVEKLCIVPDGPLWNLPFQALYTGDKQYLLEQYTIFFAPSLTVLREMSRKRDTLLSGSKPAGAASPRAGEPPAHHRPTLLALGNPALAGEADAAVNLIYQKESLAPLPEAEREARTIAELYGQSRSRLLIGDQAREGLVKSEAGKFRVLHFAAHSILDDRNPMYSRIVLSQDAGETQEDGVLEAWEIMRLDLTADLAIFSACQTGQGGVSAGEGVIGMSWALFVAGCPSAVVSQWKVDSARTADLMIEFHRGLTSRQAGAPAKVTKAEALRGAALKLLRGPFKHPAYWAGFVLVGVDV
jgi:CHAT domain-containing protein